MNTIWGGMCAALLFGAVAACGSDAPSAPEAPAPECDPAAETAQVFGPWVFTYEGAREGCENERLNGRYQVHPGFELEVSQRERGDQPDELRLTRAIEGLRYAGSVEGDCVRFSVELEASGISMGMSGAAEDGRVRGGFRGVGPGTCTASGHFEVKLREAALRW